MKTLKVFVQGKFMTFQEFKFRLVFTVSQVFCSFATLLQFTNAINKHWIQTCCETSCSLSGTCNTSSKIKFIAESWTRVYSTVGVNLQYCILVQDKLVTNMVMWVTMGFNLQCNNFVSQIKGKCCPYYQTWN